MIDCWWWEAGHLTKEKMRWQLGELKDKGVSGTFLYPRFTSSEPLAPDPPYWTEKWWDCVRFTAETEQQLGLRLWVSDWGGHQRVRERLRKEGESNPEFVGHRLVIHQKESHGNELVEIEVPPGEDILHAAAYKKLGDGLDYSSQKDLRDAVDNHTLRWHVPQADWLVAVIASQPHELDFLNRALTERWLQMYFGEYERRVPEFLGKTLAAYGIDDFWVLVGNALYSRSLAEMIRTQRGYDIAPFLIGLFHDIGAKTDQIRCDYYGAMSCLLEDNFYKPFAQWLDAHGMKYVTIAPIGREDLLEHTFEYGDFFRFMRWFDIPGNEDSGQQSIPERHLIHAKLSSSIAHLYAKKQVAVCAYWGAGWGMTQEENLAWTNGNYAWGINLFNQHGGLYTLMGGWYEWVPPDVDYWQPYWQSFKVFADYVRRLSYVMSQGVHRADVALLHPLTTFHANWIAGKVSTSVFAPTKELWPAFAQPAQEASETTMNLARGLCQSMIDFDFIDYHSLERSQVEGAKLEVSDLVFRVLVLPPMTTVRLPTLQKIRDFYAAGGTVIAFGRLPGGSAENGRGDPEIRSLINEIFGVAPEQSVTETVERRNQNEGKAFFVPEDVGHVPDIISENSIPDVVCHEKNLYYTHQKVGELEVYFLVNTEGEYRTPTISFRATGDLELWDPFTGRIEKVYRIRRQHGGTAVRLTMAPYQGSLLVFTPASTGVEVLEDNLTELSRVEATREGFRIRGLDEAGGKKKLTVRQDGKEFTADVAISPPPPPMNLKDPFSSHLQPTMDNRWGDFRYPPSKVFIGPEARSFRYMEERLALGDSLGWHEPQFDDSTWPVVRYSYGPYWWHIGPFEESREPARLEEDASYGRLELDRVYESGGSSLRWEPYTFSQEFGYFGDIHRAGWAGLQGVSENFLVLPNRDLPKASHFLATWVHSPKEGDFTLYFGGTPEKFEYGYKLERFQVPDQRLAWINGDRVLDIREKRTDEVSAQVHLKEGWNAVLLKLVLRSGLPPKGDITQDTPGIATYAVIRASAPPPRDPYVPRIRWFSDGQTLTYDISPNKEKRVGWYRFKAPPGLKGLHLGLRAKRADCWIDGRPVPTEGSKVRLDSVMRKSVQVALRVDQVPGTYAGAAFPEPIAFECEEGEIAPGDWSPQGLETYSGAVLYGKVVTLNKEHLSANIVLDLGMVKTCAEVLVNGKLAGVRLARPFRFNVTDLVREGDNEIQINVVNTLANHMSSYPTESVTKYVNKGQNVAIPSSVRTRSSYPRVFSEQTISGLLGPVQMRFLSKVNLTVKAVKKNS